MSDYEFTLPWPPSVNGYWRSFMGRQIISKRGREYVKQVENVMRDLGLHGEGLDCPLSVSIKLNPPTLRKYDVDNFSKGVFDALSKCGYWVDDDIVQSLTVTKGSKQKGGNVFVRVNLIDDITNP